MLEINLGIGIIALFIIFLFPSITNAEEKPKSWKEQAAAEGFEFLPSSDLKGIREAANALKEFRALVPEEFRGKEKEFFESATTAIEAIKKKSNDDNSELGTVKGELKTTRSNYTKLETEHNTLKEKTQKLEKENRDMFIWGHIDKEVARRNVAVHPRLISDNDVNSFNLDDFKEKIGTEEGMKNFREALYKKVIEPAHKATLEVRGNIPTKTEPKPITTTEQGKDGQAAPIAVGFGKGA